MRGRGSGNSDEFIREVDEAVRQEQWFKLWQQYGTYAIAAALAIVVGTAAGVGWRTYQQNQRLDEARRYAAAQQLLRDDQPAEAAAAFASLAQDANGGYRVIAELSAAAAQGDAGDDQAKVATLTKLADDDDAASVYRGLAELLAAQEDFNTAGPAVALAKIEPLAAADRPWRHSALELRAVAEMQSGDTAAARQTLDDLLADPATPPDLARRAAELLAFLGGPLAAADATDAGAASEAVDEGAAPAETSNEGVAETD